MEDSRSIVDSALQYGELSHVCVNMDPIDVDARVMTKDEFMYKHGKDYATYEEANNKYQEYCRTHGKQATHVYWRIEEQQGEEFEYCYWFCAILQERQLGVISWGRAES
ncbi:hypothetical protein G9A89_020282 [Geosiphon pyriformis]|nr:hypothetical protein G9A89_020282 [Geosiphon pyriformis]